VAKDCPQARPVIRAVDIETSEGTASASEGGRTPAIDVEAVVKAVLAKTKKASADIKKKKPVVKGAPHLTNHFDVLADCTYGIGMDMFSGNLPDSPPSAEPLQEEPDAPYDCPPQLYSLSHTPEQSAKIPVCLCSIHSGATHSVAALLDSGATDMFIDWEFVLQNNLETRPIPKPMPVYNVDGTPDWNGSIYEEYEAILEIGDHSERVSLAVTSLG
jgi:hypothetical protein